MDDIDYSGERVPEQWRKVYQALYDTVFYIVSFLSRSREKYVLTRLLLLDILIP